MFQSYFSYSALSSQHFRPLLITRLLANSLEAQAHCLRNGELAPHPLVSCSTAGSGFSRGANAFLTIVPLWAGGFLWANSRCKPALAASRAHWDKDTPSTREISAHSQPGR